MPSGFQTMQIVFLCVCQNIHFISFHFFVLIWITYAYFCVINQLNILLLNMAFICLVIVHYVIVLTSLFLCINLTFQVSQYAQHSSYDRNTLNNDISMLRLGTTIDFNGNVQSISLPSSDIGDLAGVTSTVTGYGTTSFGQCLQRLSLS